MIIGICVNNFKYLIFIILNKRRLFIRNSHLLSRICCNRPCEQVEFLEIQIVPVKNTNQIIGKDFSWDHLVYLDKRKGHSPR